MDNIFDLEETAPAEKNQAPIFNNTAGKEH